MDIPLTSTKIVVPRRPRNLLTREHLLNLLYDLLDYRLIIIAAPAGYGKTSLLIDLAHHDEMPVCWYALDALDQNPERFLAHFVGTIARRFPGFGKQSAAALHHMTSADRDIDRLVSIIVNEAYEQIREHFAVVLDDYHLIGDCELVNRFVSQFIQKVDENCHLVLSSRTLLSLPELPLLVARSQAGGMAFGDLAFRADELQALMLQNYHLTLSASEAARLVQETEGWITGLLLSAETMWQGMADRVRAARVSGVGLYDYLVQQVLDQQTPPVRDFLLRTSLMDEFDAELCEAVLGPGENWQCMIDLILRSNLFVLPVDDGSTWLRYHHLFREFLQSQLARECPKERSCLLRRLAAAYAARHEWEKAYDVYQRLGDMGTTADFIEEVGTLLTSGGQWVTLAKWIDALPADTLDSRPGLVSLRGFAAVELGDVKRGLSLLNRAEVAFRAAGDGPQLARTLVRRAVDLRLIGNYLASLADAEEALALTANAGTLGAVQAEALRAKGVGLGAMGQLSEAILWLEKSLVAYDTLGDAQNAAMLLMELGLAHKRIGCFERALTHYNRALDYWRKTENVVRQANLLNNLGVLYHSRGDYESAEALLEEALNCARRTGSPRIEALALSSIGDLYVDMDAPNAAREAFHQARKIARRIDYRFLLFCLDLAEASLSRSCGDLVQARTLMESAQRAAQRSDSTYEQAILQMEAGRLALAERNAPQADIHFEDAARYFDGDCFRVEAARIQLYLAIVWQAAEDKKTALSHLRKAFLLTVDMESQHPMVVTGRQAKTLLETAQNDPMVGEQASTLLQQVIQFEQGIPMLRRRLRRQAAAVPFAPPRLTFHALGAVEVRVGEQRVTGADWQAQVARDLLFCLLAHPDGLTKEAIGVIFWPDHSPAQLKLQFKKTIYRLRRALGQDVVQLDQDRYRFNRALDYEYDVDSFGAKLEQARVNTNSDERAAIYGKAVDLYKGPYLPDMDGIWVYSERERLWQDYAEAMLSLAGQRLETGDYGSALDWCQRLLAQDSCLEEAHRVAMRAHAALGNQAGVTRQFERCWQALSAEANAPLSPETQMLYNSLTRR